MINDPRPQSFTRHSPAVEGVSDERPVAETAFRWIDALRIALICVSAIAVRWQLRAPESSVLAIVSIVAAGWPIFKVAAENLAGRRMTMELSMSIAIIAAAAIHEFF